MKRILLVEDDKNVAHSMVRVLRLHGYQVVYSPTIADARKVLKTIIGNNDPIGLDIVLLDRNMQGENGWELEKEVPEGVKVILMAGYAPDAKRRIYTKGLDSVQILYDMIENLV